MNRENRKYYLQNLVFIIGLIVLLTNDHYLKLEYSNWLTGKLSDFIGVLILPMVLTYLFPRSKKTNVILNALIRKTQIRLMDSNKQSNELANEVSALLDQLDSKTPPKKNLLEERIKKLRTNINKIQNSTET